MEAAAASRPEKGMAAGPSGVQRPWNSWPVANTYLGRWSPPDFLALDEGYVCNSVVFSLCKCKAVVLQGKQGGVQAKTAPGVEHL